MLPKVPFGPLAMKDSTIRDVVGYKNMTSHPGKRLYKILSIISGINLKMPRKTRIGTITGVGKGITP